jgi:hypothetical protein
LIKVLEELGSFSVSASELKQMISVFRPLQDNTKVITMDIITNNKHRDQNSQYLKEGEGPLGKVIIFFNMPKREGHLNYLFWNYFFPLSKIGIN